MLKFKEVIEVISEANTDEFMAKINSCKTKDSLKELTAYYKKRSKEVELKDSDDISIRDALEGRRIELETTEEEEEESF